MSYYAEVINLSLKNDKILEGFPILRIRKRFLGLLKIYTIEVDEKNIDETIRFFQKNMSTKLRKEWYITFHTEEKAIIVFRKRIFQLSIKGIEPVYQKVLDVSEAEDREKWEEVIRYAKSLGVPDNQCDFLPEMKC
ncbi:MAG: hypothetical protein PUF65_00245 [Lachnospiraceae bacterium]|nr:hypothetical protein [Lachnospiraceae bacterium]